MSPALLAKPGNMVHVSLGRAARMGSPSISQSLGMSEMAKRHGAHCTGTTTGCTCGEDALISIEGEDCLVPIEVISEFGEHKHK